MNINYVDIIRKIQNRCLNRSNVIFDCPYKRQIQYVENIKAPGDDIERAFCQYKCQMYLFGIKSILANFIALPILLWECLKKEGYSTKKNKPIQCQEKCAVFYHLEELQDIIPEELKEQYSLWHELRKNIRNYSENDRKYFFKVIEKHPFSWLFLLKCLLKLKVYSAIIEKYHPNAIVTCCEYSYTSSFLTDYCEYRGVKHINIMHGEKIFYIRDSFFRFHECYVWDQHYINLFKKMYADDSQFKIAVPKSLIFDMDKHVKKTVDYTYYLANEDSDTLRKIAGCLEQLQKAGNIVKVRTHPRYSNLDTLKKIFNKKIIEEPIHLEESVKRSKNVIGLYTTVLNQAFHNNVNIVIDDISNIKNYNKLRELDYIMFQKKYIKLSDILAK